MVIVWIWWKPTVCSVQYFRNIEEWIVTSGCLLHVLHVSRIGFACPRQGGRSWAGGANNNNQRSCYQWVVALHHLPSSLLTWRHWKGKASSWRRSKWGCFALYGDCGTGRQNLIFYSRLCLNKSAKVSWWPTMITISNNGTSCDVSGWITLTIQQIANRWRNYAEQ